MKKNVVLVDYDRNSDWDFLRGLKNATHEDWILECQESSGDHGGIKNLIRYLKYFSFPIHILRKRTEYEKVICWQQFHGIILSFYFKLFRIRRDECPKLYVMELIYKPKAGLIGKIYNKFINYSIKSPYISKIFVFSRDERERYKILFGLSDNDIVTIHLGIQDRYSKYKDDIKDDGYYVAAGRSNRDYDFLLKEWPENIPLKIICDNKKLDVRDNIEQLTNCYREEYHKILAGCHGVVIPLEDEMASSGQLVMLQSMMFGKPIIITENKTVRDYLIDGEDGYVINKNGNELKDRVIDLMNNQLWKKISKIAREHFVISHSELAMGRNVGTIIRTGN